MDTSRMKAFGMVVVAGIVVALASHTTPTGAIVPSTWSAVMSSNTGNSTIANIESINGDISGAGRYVAFESGASNLVAGVSGRQVYRKDTTTGITALVSSDSAGVAGNNNSREPSISADGRWIAFYSVADNLVLSDSNGLSDIFVKDMNTGATVRASTDGAGAQVTDLGSFYPSVSNNGKIVAFTSWSSMLVAGDTNSKGDVFVKNLTTGTTVRVSTTSAGAQGNGPGGTNARYPSITGDGRQVVFESGFNDLVPGDSNGTGDAFWKDLSTNELRLVSASASGTIGDDQSRRPRIARTNRYVSFTSLASNLVGGDAPGTVDVFLKDMGSGAITMASTDSSGVPGNDTSGRLETSAPSSFGRDVVFASRATNLVAADGNQKVDVFKKDLQTGVTTRVSANVGGGDANEWSAKPTINNAGTRVAFESAASNLVSPSTVLFLPQVYRANA